MSNSGAAHEVGFRVLAHFPPVDFAFSYGSAVIPQVRADGRADTRDGKMMDFIFAVDDPVEWHRNVLTEHPTHYSLLGKLGPHAVSLVQSLGAGVYFNPMVRLTDPSLPLIKYGVVSSKRFRKDLRDWDQYVSNSLSLSLSLFLFFSLGAVCTASVFLT
jgi:translocator assembly and maintenance protein 41